MISDIYQGLFFELFVRTSYTDSFDYVKWNEKWVQQQTLESKQKI